MSVPASRTLTRWAAVVALLTCGAFALGARCIENTSVYVDDEGYTHIVGQMFNETTVQGTAILVRGTLYDQAGAVIASKDSATCPPDSQPQSQVMFDIRFDNPGIPAHATYDVRPIYGLTLNAPLPSPKIVVLGTDAVSFEGLPNVPSLPGDDDVFFTFDIRNQSDTTYVGVQGCAAAYDHLGNVVSADATELIQLDEDGNPSPAILTNERRQSVFMHIGGVPPTANVVRAWMWFGPKDAPTSQYGFIMTPAITIRTRQLSAP